MSCRHTIVVSDLHLTEPEPPDPGRPLWKRFKRADLFIDDRFARLLAHLRGEIGAPFELVLAGDIFDFDSITSTGDGRFATTWLERRRGLASEQPKSAYKMALVMDHHPVFFQALRELVAGGSEVVFIIGNHDIELHWQAVQALILRALGDPGAERVRFCAWFTVSEGDTLIEHGNQYDPYCLCHDPVFPLVGSAEAPRVRLPFGNLAGKLMLNGMGLFNPHVDSSYVRGSLGSYLVFFYRYLVRTQPLLPLAWFWSALATLLVSLREGFLPALRDPSQVEARFAAIAAQSRATPAQVRALDTLRVHPAIFSPWKVARELWLDRALLLLAAVWGAFQVYSLVNVFHTNALPWFAVALVVLLPPFLFYAHSVTSDIHAVEQALRDRLPQAASIVGVRRVVLGHIHRELHHELGGVELLNGGTWSPAFTDPECTVRLGRTCLTWIRPDEDGTRHARVLEWTDPGLVEIGSS